MSAVSEQDDKNKTFDIKSIKRLSNRKLTRTELIILVSCVLFITLLTLINLLIYTLKKLHFYFKIQIKTQRLKYKLISII